MNEAQNLVMSLLEKAGVADGMSILSQESGSMFRFSRNRMTVANSLEEASMTIFIRHSAGSSAAQLADLRPESLERAVAEMVATLPEDDGEQRLPSGPFSYLASNAVELELDGDGPVSMVLDAAEAARAEGAEQVAGTLSLSNSRISIRSTRGIDASALLPQAELSMRAFLDPLSSGHGLSVSDSLSGIDPIDAGREAGSLAVACSNVVDCPPGEYEALLYPMVAADVVSQLGRMASSFYAGIGMSFLADRIGEQVCSPLLSLEDDPTLPSTLGSRAFDDEGVPTQRRTIIEDGVLRRHLHNHSSAVAADGEAGNAGLLVPKPFNLVVSPGEEDPGSMRASMERGIVVSNMWYLRYQNYRSGDFSAIPRDAMFLVEDGEVVGAVRGLRISDNVLGMLSRIRSLSQERRWVRWWEVSTPTLCPFMHLDDLSFTRSTM